MGTANGNIEMSPSLVRKSRESERMDVEDAQAGPDITTDRKPARTASEPRRESESMKEETRIPQLLAKVQHRAEPNLVQTTIQNKLSHLCISSYSKWGLDVGVCNNPDDEKTTELQK